MNQRYLTSTLAILFLLTATLAHAGGYRTVSTFAPDKTKVELIAPLVDRMSSMQQSYKDKYGPEDQWKAGAKQSINREKRRLLNLIIDFGYDINKVTMLGWEVKSSRRARFLFWEDERLGKEYIWGTEYILQKPIP